MRIGLDIGSTTIKCVALDDRDNLIYRSYERHFSQIVAKTAELLERLRAEIPGSRRARLSISGSAGMGLAENAGVPFIQEVFATRIAARRMLPDADVIVELGGEDAKILFLTGGTEVRMNGSCAGGTGAFIDQMATLLDVSLDEMDRLAGQAERTYTIASRCGVFAKSDIQPLLNQGAKKSDIARSIMDAVVNQTIAGLAQGREIKGNVIYLGGPLTFLKQLRESFDRTLGLRGILPEDSLYFVALGAAYGGDREMDLDAVVEALSRHKSQRRFATIRPLFESRAEYQMFCERHQKASVPEGDLARHRGPVHIGIDAGSTTLKAVVIGPDGELLRSVYRPNSGNPVPLVRDFLLSLYQEVPDLQIRSAAVTGYGEQIIQSAFGVDFGVVETVAHFTAAKKFLPQVDFVIDIGGQDMKCFKIKNGAVDNIFLNEACSSGCGSFLQTFANALGYSIEEFAKLGLFADAPVDLGSRCTVFMNSSVKQAQKDGASIENISAGLSISVVKNALYKVIRASSARELGENIVVQGGTFYNDAVLRAFEQEMGTEVIRPDIAGLMGAYGAALYAAAQPREASGILGREALEQFSHEVKNVGCGLCGNNCRLTVNLFSGGRRFISGNRCERPVTHKEADHDLNLYEYKRELIAGYRPVPGPRGKIGIPLGLNLWELLPFWHALFTRLGFEVVASPFSDRELYLRGQSSIPSDTVCFPAKLLHGHVQTLVEMGVKTIFYPCMTYNLDEHLGDNHYNCPVVAYYPEVLSANMPSLRGITFIGDYVGLHRRREFPQKLTAILQKYFDGITAREVKAAVDCGFAEYEKHLRDLRERGKWVIERARAEGKRIIVLAGRPYHVDPEINHGVDRLITSLGAAVVSEEAVSCYVDKFPTTVLNQWTYHSRLYAAAKYVCGQKDMELVQLVSFGCGVDAITTDETREILEAADRLYTQIKIDEITNLGAVKIRLRSLFAAAGQMNQETEKNVGEGAGI